MNKKRLIALFLLVFGFSAASGAFQFFQRLLGISVITVTVSPVYSVNGSNWNDYILRANSGGSWNDYNQTTPATACTGLESGRYESCIHGGEKRMAVITGLNSCTGITASDNLNAFDWECMLNGSSVATVYSKGLKSTARLSDLLNSTSWKANFINIYKSGNLIAKSAATTWWTNPIQAPPANSLATDAEQVLSTAGTIYYVSSNTATSGYLIQGDKIGFVVAPGVKLTYSGRTTKPWDLWGGGVSGNQQFVLVGMGGAGTNPGRRFLWIEGTYDSGAYPSDYSGFPMSGYGVRFSVFRNLNLISGPNANSGGNGGFGLVYSYSNLMKNISVTSARGCWIGIMEYSNTWMRWHDIYVAANSGGNLCNTQTFQANGASNIYTNIQVFGGNRVMGAPDWASHAIAANYISESTFSGILAVGANGVGLATYTAPRNTFHQMTVANNVGHAVVFQDSNYVTLNSAVAANNGSNGGYGGFFLQNSTNFRLSQLAAAHQMNSDFSGSGLMASSTSTSGQLLNYILLGNNDTDCTTYSASAGYTSSCTNQGTSTAIYRTGISLANSFVGKVTSNDVANASDSSGSQTQNSITDWMNFDNRFRGWGLDGSAFPNINNRGACLSGTCRVWDWRLKSTDTVLLNTSNNGSAQNAAFVAGTPCPAAVNGNYAITDQKTSPQTFLVNAVEIIGDYQNGLMVGNDDGLCESGEACIYSPNFGAYQGEGNYLAAGTCNFTPGTVTNVQMYAYPSNGGL